MLNTYSQLALSGSHPHGSQVEFFFKFLQFGPGLRFLVPEHVIPEQCIEVFQLFLGLRFFLVQFLGFRVLFGLRFLKDRFFLSFLCQ